MLAALVAALALATPPAQFQTAAGWHTGSARLQDAGCARCVQTESWASTVRYADAPNQLPPHQTMAELGPGGIIVHMTRSWEPSPPAWMLQRHPLRILRSSISTSFEGNTTRGRVSRWLASTWRAGSYVTVWVLFGAPSPTAATVARAQARLDTVRLPPWSTPP